jgi:hypothetical protein
VSSVAPVPIRAGGAGGGGDVIVYVNGILTDDPKHVRVLLEDAGVQQRLAVG